MPLFGRKPAHPDPHLNSTGSNASTESTAPESYVPGRRGKLKIPQVVKKNTARLAMSQAFVGTGNQMMPALGALAILQVTHSAALTGLGTAMISISRFIISYPAGKISDRFGRKRALFIGLALGILGAPLIGLGVLWSSFPILTTGFFVFGLGMGMAQQLRVAAADMYPPSHRGLGTGYVLMGSLVGAMLAPAIVASGQQLSPVIGIDPLGLPWLFVPVIIVPAILLVSSIRPDPQEIARNLAKHYPGYQPAPRRASERADVKPGKLLGYYPTLSAIVSSLAAQGNMAMIMFITSLALQAHGYSLAAISLSVSIHVVGMFGFTVPLGRLSDRFGRRVVLLAGVVMAGAGSMLVPYSPLYIVITLGTFLVGLGWSAVYVAATALIADASSPEERGRAVGFNDTFSYIPGIILPLIAGPLAASAGLTSVGILGMLLMVPPFILLLRLREPAPETYLTDNKTGAGEAGN